MEFLIESTYFGFCLSILAYIIGIKLNQRFKLTLINPLLVSVIIVILVLLIGKIDYNTYNRSAKYVTYLLTPATVCFAVPFYEKIKIIKDNLKAVIFGIVSGILSSFVTVLLISVLFRLTHEQYVTLLPKSITTAIGMELSHEFGGIKTLTTAAIVLTGISGSVLSEMVFKIFRIKNPVAKGIALGCSSHAVGTAKAIELGETEGAISGLSIAVSGLLTVLMMNFFVMVY